MCVFFIRKSNKGKHMAYNLNPMSAQFLQQGGGWQPSSNPMQGLQNIQGQVAGASIGPSNTSPTGGGGGTGSNPTPNPSPNPSPQPSQPSQPSWEDRIRGSINDAYGGYEAKLNEIYNSLGGQRADQEAIVGNQYQQGVNTLTGQRDIGARELQGTREKTETTQNKTMKELAEAMRDQFMAGQVMLGTRGAGDSSAANQYAYALTKEGNKQRGDIATQYAGIQNDINDREFKLNTTYDSEIKNIALERDSKINQISVWFSEQQNNIRQMQAEGGLRKGQDLANLTMNMYNQAMNAVNEANSEASNRRLMLDQWAMNNSENIQQLKQNMAGISETNYSPPAFQGLNSSLAMGSQTPANSYVQGNSYGSTEDQYRQTV